MRYQKKRKGSWNETKINWNEREGKNIALTVEQLKQKEKEIEILKLQIELEKETQKHKIEMDPTVSSKTQCQEYYGLKSVKFSRLL